MYISDHMIIICAGTEYSNGLENSVAFVRSRPLLVLILVLVLGWVPRPLLGGLDYNTTVAEILYWVTLNYFTYTR